MGVLKLVYLDVDLDMVIRSNIIKNEYRKICNSNYVGIYVLKFIVVIYCLERDFDKGFLNEF